MKAVFLSFLILSCGAFASENSPRMVVHLLNYIASDYEGAVSNHGTVLSKPEYEEQLEFTKTAVETALTLPELKGEVSILQGMTELQALVKTKAKPQRVAQQARLLSENIIRVAKVPLHPRQWPHVASGQKAYEENCASCHGVTGHGDGPSGGSLDPKPTNFFDSKVDSISPFQMYNTIRLGVPGTGMSDFSVLGDETIWNLAFYISSLRHPKPAAIQEAGDPAFSLEEASTLSDEAMGKKFTGDPLKKNDWLARVRWFQPSGTGAPALLEQTNQLLLASVAAFEKREFARAKELAVSAYLDGVEPLEPKLRARVPGFTEKLEISMMEVRSRIDKRDSVESLRSAVENTQGLLLDAGKILARPETSAWITFSVAAGIFLREAFEAALIVITLLGLVRSLGKTKASHYVHLGWGSAIFVGIIGWFLSGWLIQLSGAGREILEGVISLVAVAVLLYFGFWLHRKTEIGRWKKFIEEMVRVALEKKSLAALFGVAFMAVFREALETILFLRVILIEAGPGQEWILLLGVGSAFAFVLVASSIAIRWSAKIPIRQLFLVSTWILFFLAFVLLGKGIHSLQETGWISTTTLNPLIHSEFLGIYPTIESLLPQVFVALFALVVWWLGRSNASASQGAVRANL